MRDDWLMQVDEVAGFCGAELLPHATGPRGEPVPIICTQAPHPRGTWHSNAELRTDWHPRQSE